MRSRRHSLLVSVLIYTILALLSHGIAPAEAQGQRRPRAEPGRTCTWYVSPRGRPSSSGQEPASPLPLRQAARRTRPGDVVCLLPGTYDLKTPLYISRGGTAAAYVTYRSHNPARKALIRWVGSRGDDMFQVNSRAGYITLQGLEFDGNDRGTAAIKCSRGSHHIRVLGNTISNAGQGGVSAVGCDYLTVDGNRIHLTGYGKGWGSGISLNKSIWYDRAAGFHSFVVNNIISGSYDNSDFHSDGNGIIMDLGGDTPPALIANNLVYQNGGRCIHIYHNQNKWVVNNTCYQNILDSQLTDENGGAKGEYSVIGSSNVYLINNLVSTAAAGHPFKQADSRRVTYYCNAYYSENGLIGIPRAAARGMVPLQQADPLFVQPVKPAPGSDQQYRRALPPGQAAGRFRLLPDSPLIDAGVDPRSVPGMTPALRAGLELYALRDLDGTARPQGRGFDIGAYEHRGRADGSAGGGCQAHASR